jgi:uncharacterized protein YbgA (DUF1722 family)/uncharacterized protein YbbK (DUF523 family)
MKKIKLGISKCLTGERVRYDGQHQRNRFLMDTLSEFAEYVPVCPEADCGLPIPREAMRLVGDPENPRLLTIKSGRDITPQMNRWVKPVLRDLAKEDLCGFVFKSKSPSSGLHRVKVYQEGNSTPKKQGRGIFAAAFVERFPDIPVEEEGRLNDPALRECFIDKVCAYSEFQALLKKPGLKKKDLTEFHAAYKYCIMAHNPAQVSELGRLLAQGGGGPKKVASVYLSGLMKALDRTATRRKQTNVLQHLSGYFKKQLSVVERDELHRIINEYYEGLYPLLAPLVLLRHYAVIYENKYLLGQRYLNPGAMQMHCRL